MLCTTESHRLEVGAGIFLGLRTWFPEKGSSPGKGGRTARHMWRSVSLQSQATGHRQTAPRGPEETPGPPTCPLPSGLWVHCWPWAPLCGFKIQCRAGVSKTATFLLGMQLQLGLGMEEGGKEEGEGHPRGSGGHQLGDNGGGCALPVLGPRVCLAPRTCGSHCIELWAQGNL